MKQILKLLIFQLFFLSYGFSQNIQEEFFLEKQISKYERFFRQYKFKIYSSKKEAGYVNIKISSYSSSANEVFRSEVESFADIPILFFIGNTENYEVEYYDKDFIPTKSTFISFEGKKEYITTTEIIKKEENKFECYLLKKGKKTKERKFDFAPPVLTPGNIIPLVTTIWDFEKQKEVSFKFIDKDILKLGDLRLEYLGETKDGFYKVKAVLPYFKLKFTIYLDKEKNIKYAQGLGLKIYAVEQEEHRIENIEFEEENIEE